VDFDVIDQLLITYSEFIGYWDRMGLQWGSTSVTFRLQKACDSGEKCCTTL